jgi:hypothetical protein
VRGIRYNDVCFFQEFNAFRASEISVSFEDSQFSSFVVFQNVFDVEKVFASVPLVVLK